MQKLSKMPFEKLYFPLLSIMVLFFFSCGNSNVGKIKEDKVDEAHKEEKKVVNEGESAQPAGKLPFKVSANLIYDDGSLSTFDILNNKSVALWNVIIGEGDAEKHSNNTLLKLSGNLDSMRVKISNGDKLVIDTAILHADKDLKWVIKETGCDKVYINIVKKSVYNDTIPFACGE